MARNFGFPRITLGRRGRRSRLRTFAALVTSTALLALTATPASAARIHQLSGSFGSLGSAGGQFALAAHSGLATDAAGDVYVADTGNHRVDQFSSSGTFVRAWGWGVVDGAAEFQVCTSTCEEGVSGAAPGQFEAPTAIAVDDSCDLLGPACELADPSANDIYVADEGRVTKFNSSGELQAGWGSGGQLDGSSATDGPFAAIAGLAVDASGNLAVLGASGLLYKFAQGGGFVEDFPTEFGTAPVGLALGAGGDIYKVRGSGAAVELGPEGTEVLNPEIDPGPAAGLAADPSSGDLYIAHEAEVAHYQAAGEPIDNFGAADITAAASLAVNGADQRVYVADAGAAAIESFEAVDVPTVTTAPASNLGESSATLNGAVNPEGVELSECFFEVGATQGYGEDVPCAESAAEIGAGTSSVPVHADLGSLQPNATYHYRLVASNPNGSEYGSDRILTTLGPPTILAESATDLGSTSATLRAQIRPASTPGTYSYQYGTTAAYGSSTATAGLGVGTEAVNVSAQLHGLAPATTYHYRVSVSDESGPAFGEDQTFTTAGLGPISGGLPDARGYEMVSPASNFNADAYVWPGTASRGSEHGISTGLPMRASANGDRVAYAADATIGNGSGGGQGGGNPYLGRRQGSGWSQVNLAGEVSESQSTSTYSSDLSRMIVSSVSPLTSGSPADEYERLYSRGLEAGSISSLFDVTPPDRAPGEFGTVTVAGIRRSLGTEYPGESTDGARQFFAANDALTPNAIDGGATDNNLYESAGGALTLANLLPNGQPSPGATFGSQAAEIEQPPDYEGAISADGSRVFWTDLIHEALYVREGATATSQVDLSHGPGESGGGLFWAASEDGARVFFTDCRRLTTDSTADPASGCVEESGGQRDAIRGSDLYEYDVASHALTDLSVDHDFADPSGAQVQGLAGISPDGSYVYFVAEGDLAAGATSGQPNLYLSHDGVTTFVATLSPEDNRINFIYGRNANYGDWVSAPGFRTAQAAGDGSLTFMSERDLEPGHPTGGAYEVYVFNPARSELSCASCGPSGALPDQTLGGAAAYLQTSGAATFQQRWLSADGARVFFDSPAALLPSDTNGHLDVYEWERGGTGSCQQPAGCLYLLSGGESSDNSYFLDASASGDDVFIITRSRLVPGDPNENYDVYDARVGAVAPSVSPSCPAQGCGVTSLAPPAPPTPGSATFQGPGDPRTHGSRHNRHLRHCRKLKSHRKRAHCESQLRASKRRQGTSAGRSDG